MATQGQLYTRLKTERLKAYWQIAQAHGFTGAYEEWLEIAEPDIEATTQADAKAIFEFLTQDIRVKEGIAVSVASGIDVGDKLGAPPWPDETKEAGTGQTDEQGRLE